jgi:hypothetical protein
MKTRMSHKNEGNVIPKLLIALLIGGCSSYAQSQQAAGRLFVYGSLQASYYAEARSEQFVSIGQGVAEGDSLRLTAQPGPATIRVMKANSASARYSIVIVGGKEDFRMGDLAYGTTVTVRVPESNSGLPLTLCVIPD